MSECCGTCIFNDNHVYKYNEESFPPPHSGSCRRFPPVPTYGTQAMGIFPRVRDDEWCGEYKSVDKEKA